MPLPNYRGCEQLAQRLTQQCQYHELKPWFLDHALYHLIFKHHHSTQRLCQLATSRHYLMDPDPHYIQKAN